MKNYFSTQLTKGLADHQFSGKLKARQVFWLETNYFTPSRVKLEAICSHGLILKSVQWRKLFPIVTKDFDKLLQKSDLFPRFSVVL